MTVPNWGLTLGAPVLLLGLPALVLWAVGHLPTPGATGMAGALAPGAVPPQDVRCAELRRRGLAGYPRAVGAHFPAAGHQLCRDHCGPFARRRRRSERAVVLYGTAVGCHIHGWCPYCTD